MSQSTDRLEAAHRFQETEYPCEVVYGEHTWPALAGQVSYRRGDRRSGGQFAEHLGSVSIRRSVVGGTFIKKGTPITVDGEPYFVGEIRKDPIAFEIDLATKT